MLRSLQGKREEREVFTVYSENDRGSTPISNLFIDQYMKDANDAQLKVYLYLLRMMNAGRPTSISDMADQFNHTEKEVLRSLRYWESRGLIAFEYGNGGELLSLHMLTPRSAPSASPVYSAVPQSEPVQSAGQTDTVQGSYADRRQNSYLETASPVPGLPRLQPMAIPAQHTPAAKEAVPASAPQYERENASAAAPKVSARHPDAASVEAFRSSAKRAQLLFVIEQYIGKPLAPSEVESVYYISEELHFSDALIDYLLQYCIDRGKKDFRYIEKVAVNWAEHGITTPKQAERAVSGFGKNRRGYSGVKPSANPFNQFEQNQYDFDQLEKEILSN